MTADEADPEVQPLAARPQAVLAALDGRRQLADGDLVEVGADGVAHVTSSTAGVRERWAWTNWTAIAPSPTAVAQRLVEPERTSPAANTPGTSVSSRLSVFGCRAGEDEAVVVAADGVVEPLGARQRAEEEEQERVREALAALQRDGLEVPVLAVERRDLAPVANGDAVALELVDEVVGHRLAEVGAAVEERDERAAAGEPDGGLAGGVAAADDRDARAGAELGLGRPGGVEDRQSPRTRPGGRPGAAGTGRPSRAGRRARRSPGRPRGGRDAGRSPVRGRARGTASRCAR